MSNDRRRNGKPTYMKANFGTTEPDDLAIAVPEGILFQDVGGEIVLLNIETGEYYGLNEVGSRIWTLFQEGQPVSQVLTTLLSEYDVFEEGLRSDVKQFLLQLQSKHIIEINERSSP